MATKVILKEAPSKNKNRYINIATGVYFTVKEVPNAIYVKTINGPIVISSACKNELGRTACISEDHLVRPIDLLEIAYTYVT